MSNERKVIKTETYYQIWKDNDLIQELDLEISKENDFRAKRVFDNLIENDITNVIKYDGETIYSLEKVTFEFYDDDDIEEIETEIMNEIRIYVE